MNNLRGRGSTHGAQARLNYVSRLGRQPEQSSPSCRVSLLTSIVGLFVSQWGYIDGWGSGLNDTRYYTCATCLKMKQMSLYNRQVDEHMCLRWLTIQVQGTTLIKMKIESSTFRIGDQPDTDAI